MLPYPLRCPLLHIIEYIHCPSVDKRYQSAVDAGISVNSSHSLGTHRILPDSGSFLPVRHWRAAGDDALIGLHWTRAALSAVLLLLI